MKCALWSAAAAILFFPGGLLEANEIPLSLDLGGGRLKVKPADARFAQSGNGGITATYQNNDLKTFRRVVFECSPEAPLPATRVLLRIDPDNVERIFVLIEDGSGSEGGGSVKSLGAGEAEYEVDIGSLKAGKEGFPDGKVARVTISVPMVASEGEHTVRLESVRLCE